MGEALAVALDAETGSRHSRTPSSRSCSTRGGSTCRSRCTPRSAPRSSTSIPAASGAAIGDTSHRDFRRLAASIERIDDGGVVLNLGSAVIMPEVFLKALTIARNVNAGAPRGVRDLRPRHAAPLPSAHERRAAADAGQREGLRDHGAPRDHGADAGVGGGRALGGRRPIVPAGTALRVNCSPLVGSPSDNWFGPRSASIAVVARTNSLTVNRPTEDD